MERKHGKKWVSSWGGGGGGRGWSHSIIEPQYIALYTEGIFVGVVNNSFETREDTLKIWAA